MKKLIAGLSLLILCAGLTGAVEPAGRVGVGVMVGDLVGPTLKLWTSPTQALSIGLGFEDDFTTYAEYEWHNWTIFPKPQQGKLGGYLGLGGQIEDRDHDDNEVGIRTVGGMGYWLSNLPLEVFLEAGPVFIVSPDTDVDGTAEIGLRYYFN